MKTFSFLTVFLMVLSLGIFNSFNSWAQEKTKKNQPDIHWDVKKELDENGNIIHYDSTYSFRWSFPGDTEIDMDSLFKQYDLQFPDIFQDDFFRKPFRPYSFFPPGFQTDPFDFPDSLFSMPFEHPFFDDPDFHQFFEWRPDRNDSTHAWHFKDPFFSRPFPDIYEYLQEQRKLIEKYFYYPFYPDSIPGYQPNWYKNPGHRKKFFKELEI